MMTRIAAGHFANRKQVTFEVFICSSAVVVE